MRFRAASFRVLAAAAVFLVAAAEIFQYGVAVAETVNMNVDYNNRNGLSANDYHLKLHSSSPINIDDTYMGAYPNLLISGAGTNNVELNFSGHSVAPGGQMHIGYTASSNDAIAVTESYWTTDNDPTPFLPLPAKSVFFGLASIDYLVERITMYDDVFGTNVIGTMWWQYRAAYVTNWNWTPYPIYISWAFLRSPVAIGLPSLNSSLQGFGPESPILEIAPVPEIDPATGSSALSLVAGVLAMIEQRRRRVALVA
jgi:hypothetical protein